MHVKHDCLSPWAIVTTINTSQVSYLYLHIYLDNWDRRNKGILAGLSLGVESENCISSVQFSRSVVSNSLRPHELQHARPPYPSPSPRVHSNSRPIESVMPSSHLILCRPLLLLPPIPPSIRVFSNESALHMRWPKY